MTSFLNHSVHNNISYFPTSVLVFLFPVPEVCDRGYYGDLCTKQCYCTHDMACERLTGKCPEDKSQYLTITINATVPCNEKGKRVFVFIL